MARVRDFRLGRWQGPTLEDAVAESVGDAITNIGTVPVPDDPGPQSLKVVVPIYCAPGDTLGYQVGLGMRRTLRSLLRNKAARAQALYLNFIQDSELNGWVLVGPGDVSYDDGGPTLGQFKLTLDTLLYVGTLRTVRPARRLELYDRRLSTVPLDVLGTQYLAAFPALSALAIHPLPTGVSDASSATGDVPSTAAARTALEGTVPLLVGRADGESVAFEQAEADLLKNDVVVLDRRGTSGYGATVVAVGAPLAYWRLGEAAGAAAAADGSGNGRAGTYAGGVTLGQGGASGDGSTAALFDGVNGRVTTAYNPFAQGSTVTLAGWASRRTNTSTDALCGSDAATGQGAMLRCEAGSGNVGFYPRSGGVVTWAAAAPTGPFFHWALTYNDATRQAELFINGVSQGVLTVAAGQGFNTAPGNFEIGADRGTTDPFDGYLEDVAVWSGALTAAQIAQLYAGGLPTADPQLYYGWEEAYGPDYPVTAGDVPVLHNGLCRIRYDGSQAVKGFRVDVWNGAAWAEQGKLIVQRRGDSNNSPGTLVSASIVEWTPEKAVVLAVMQVSSDAYSRERVYITLQRGWTGPKIDIYPAPKSTGAASGAALLYTVFAADANDSLLKIDAAGVAAYGATAGSGSSQFGGSVFLGAATYTGENIVALLREGGGYTMVAAVFQPGAAASYQGSQPVAYNVNRNRLALSVDSTGYFSAQLGFHVQQIDQVMEAESMTLGGGTSSTADGAASNGNAATSTRTADAIHVSRATWPNGANGKYRVLARVKTTGAVLSLYAKTTATTGATKTTSSGAYVWVDLGEITANGSTLEIHAWNSAVGTLSVDRIEAVKVEDRTAAAPKYDGARDLGQSVLYDARAVPTLVPR